MGQQAGLGVGISVAGLFAIAGLLRFLFLRKRRNGPIASAELGERHSMLQNKAGHMISNEIDSRMEKPNGLSELGVEGEVRESELP